MRLLSAFARAIGFLKRKDENKSRDFFLYMACTFHYFLWCIRYPKLLAHRCFIERGSYLIMGRRASLSFGHDVFFKANFNGEFYGRVAMGSGVHFQANCRVTIHEGLVVGDYTGFAEGVSIHDETHPITGGSDPYNWRPLVTEPIVIGRNVWVGAKATILQGVTIGDNAVIGAHSLVTHDIPANALAFGTPARVVRIIKAQELEAQSEVLTSH